MPQGGKLLIETYNASVTEADVRRDPELRAGDYVRISVTDTGTGMAPDLAEHIFEPFFTTKEVGKGSGLGLSMVYGFVQQSGGHIGVESELAKGTTFRLCLPAARAGLAEDSLGSSGGLIHPGIGTVLIVEDHELVRSHARGQFESLGYSVVTAENGNEAISVLKDNDGIDLLFTDVVMAGGLSGFELGRIVRERWPSIRILYTSGYTQEDGDDLVGDLLPKPYSLQSLSQKVKETLGAA